MNYKFSLAVILCASLFAACSGKGESSGAGDVVVIEDGYSAKTKDEIVIGDADFIAVSTSNAGEKISSSELTKIASDSSRIDTMYDGYGNRTDTRCFNYHPRIKCVLVRSAAGRDGQKQIFVYARSGEVKKLSEEMSDKVLTLPANEIASAAGINQDYIEPAKPTVVRNLPSIENQLRPLPSYNFPVQTPQTPQIGKNEIIETESAEPQALPAETKPDKDSTEEKRDGENNRSSDRSDERN